MPPNTLKYFLFQKIFLPENILHLENVLHRTKNSQNDKRDPREETKIKVHRS